MIGIYLPEIDVMLVNTEFSTWKSIPARFQRDKMIELRERDWFIDVQFRQGIPKIVTTSKLF